MPSRDAVDFTAAVALGAVMGWSLVVFLREADAPDRAAVRSLLPTRRSARRPGTSALARGVRDEALRLFREAGDELARTAVQRVRDAWTGSGKPGRP